MLFWLKKAMPFDCTSTPVSQPVTVCRHHHGLVREVAR